MMNTISTPANWLELPPYHLENHSKQEFILPYLQQLTERHYHHSEVYRNIIDRVFGGIENCQSSSIKDIPFFPVSLFKTQDLIGVERAEVVKVLTSSGTTGQGVSKVYLDKETANLQSQVLVKIMQHFLGSQRLPMVIIDHPGVIKDRRSYSARGAGILGMMQFGHKPFYALNDDMSIDLDGLQSYLAGVGDRPVFFFGFTFMVWQYFIQVLRDTEIKLDLKNSTLIHSGGWKKLESIAVSATEFREQLCKQTKIERCLNFYGMVEQVGSVFFENSLHYLHTPIYSDIIIRDPITLKPLPDGEVGLIQVLSILPHSYPGHSILTEDLGVVRGVDSPDAGMKGRYFEVIGRVPKSETRGCSDTFSA
jgi:phenylacetate-coenzyme A ligase PaaK-like adenylate-forming protein